MLVDLASYHGTQRLAAVELRHAVQEATDADGFIWLVLDEPSESELAEIAEVFSLHPLAIEDALKARQRPKAERYGDSLFVSLRTAEYVDASESVEFGEVHLFANHHYVVIIRHGRRLALDPVRARFEGHPDLEEARTAGVVYAVLDAVVDQYGDVIAGLDDDINEVELSLFSAEGRRGSSAERIYFLKREVLEFHRALTPMLTMVGTLRADAMFAAPAPMAEYLRDVHDHLLRAADRLQIVRDLLIAALSANATEVSLRQNEDMRKISAWVAIVAVPTLIAGIYGMNFENLPELQWRYGYIFALGLMGGAALTLHRIFRRSGWL